MANARPTSGRNCPNLAQIWQTAGQDRPKSDKSGPNLAKFGPNLHNTKKGPTLVEVGRTLAGFGEYVAELCRIGPQATKFANLGHCSAAKFGPTRAKSQIPEQLFENLGSRWGELSGACVEQVVRNFRAASFSLPSPASTTPPASQPSAGFESASMGRRKTIGTPCTTPCRTWARAPA